jgi:hypothetical protein
MIEGKIGITIVRNPNGIFKGHETGRYVVIDCSRFRMQKAVQGTKESVMILDGDFIIDRIYEGDTMKIDFDPKGV